MSMYCRERCAFGSVIWLMYMLSSHVNSFNVLASQVASLKHSDTQVIVQKQARRKLDDIGGSINIDCGISDNFTYQDAKTKLQYISDGTFISTGVNKHISTDFISDAIPSSFMNVRSFPDGKRNCYTMRPPEGKARIYLIRASFMYGNYDKADKLPEFDLYVGVNFWETVKFGIASQMVIKEIIHVPDLDNIYVCLVNTGSGTPFISALEVRHFHDSTYRTESGSLILYRRLDFGSTADQIIRYHDDIYDRIWFPYNCPHCKSCSTGFPIDSLNDTDFNLPSKVMSTAATPANAHNPLSFEFDIGDPNLDFNVYMHFAELQTLQANQYREFNITLNGNSLRGGIVPNYLHSTTVTSPQSVRGAKLSFALYKSENSTLPPILNAMEIYLVRVFSQEPTDKEDVIAIEEIKTRYELKEGWQGDPCVPVYAWDGLNCTYSGYDPPRITSLNLSSRGLTGHISQYFSNLKTLQHLDLSNNRLNGSVPEFLSQLSDLRILNLEGNKLSGSVPSSLTEKSINGTLTLRLDGNQDLICLPGPCKGEKSNSIVVPLAASIVPLVIIIMALVALYIYRRRRSASMQMPENTQQEEGSSLKSDNRHFTYAEIVQMTNNFRTVIGKGGVGTVYCGHMVDGTAIAVKMVSTSSTHGSSQFRTEAHLLMRVHHRNLASFIGYCNERSNIGIIYEYMACGNLEQYLQDKRKEPLSWKERLQIALDAAQGLEYLHSGCKPPIIHRDVKCANILLNEKLQAKIADFGLSKLFPGESRSHLSTMVAGTVGYVDPEYYSSNRLTEKSDVYSFGIVLLELITGQSAIIKNHDENVHIVHWISPFLARGDIRNAVDPRLPGKLNTNSLWKFLEIAMSCVPSISIQRPTMSHLVTELKECVEADTAGEQSWKLDGQTRGSSNSLEMSVIDLETELGPEVR
ncbi:hypothetical protein K2173_009573 [Erythroxylum novogranatense]|uniref:non-specific serine/threonine protein kinase n=1 Tax=Erythroxylum novogranatense TaxID=1862640 RepID=A0AAV8U499_9ROSI|nr:hypothetical protein K2173_009573 [Erythroxylum novogranatense]